MSLVTVSSFFGQIRGRNGSGPISLLGAQVGDVVTIYAQPIANPPQSDQSSQLYEAAISVADEIQQLATTDLSAATWNVFLMRHK